MLGKANGPGHGALPELIGILTQDGAECISQIFSNFTFSRLVPEDNLSSMIYLSSNGLSGPKRTVNCKQ
jgi:hypothetical protein